MGWNVNRCVRDRTSSSVRVQGTESTNKTASDHGIIDLGTRRGSRLLRTHKKIRRATVQIQLLAPLDRRFVLSGKRKD
jgi:hypothetical protein